jgi:YggT family protein
MRRLLVRFIIDTPAGARKRAAEENATSMKAHFNGFRSLSQKERLTLSLKFLYKVGSLPQFGSARNKKGKPMGLFGEIILVFAQMANMIITIYVYIVIARAIISWVNPDPYNPIVRFLHSATDPVLYRIRRVIPLNFGGLDLSPIVLLFSLFIIQRFINILFTRLALSF